MEIRPHFSRALLHPKYWLTWIGLGFWRLLVMLPYSVLLKLGRLTGWLMYHISKKRRYFAERNLELCFPEMSAEARKKLLKENFASSGIALFETGIAWWWSARRFNRLMTFEGLENLENLNGRGALLMALHYTTLEVGAAGINSKACVDGMYRPNNNPVFDYVQRKGREKRGQRSRAYPRRDLRGVLKALRQGRVLWYAPDQDYGPNQSIFVPLFGVEAATVVATSRLAGKGNAAVLPFTHIRKTDGSGYLIKVHPALDNFPTGDERNDTLRVNQLVEQFVRECPEQYLWVHRRFKTRPEGEPSLYSVEKRRRSRRKRRKDA